MMPVPNYARNASCIRVIDGDTIECMVDQGMRDYTRDKFRLARINAPELKTPAGQDARDFLKRLLTGKQIVIETHKTEKYGRWLAEVWTQDGTNVSDALLGAGHAVLFDGRR